MKGIDEYVSTLTDLGLSTTQAKLYLALAKLDGQTAQEISRTAEVARSDVYRVLAELEEAGFVEKIISKPERFRSISVDDLVSNLIQKRIKETAELQKKTRRLANNFRQENRNKVTDEKFQFVLISGRDAYYCKIENMLENVQERICFLGLRKRVFFWLSDYLPLLDKTLTREVECQMIMPQVEKQYNGETLDVLRKYFKLNIRTIPEKPEDEFSVWDRKETLIKTSTNQTPYPYPTLWSDNKALVGLLQNYFDLLWKKAKE